jgi:hypothetical protein
MLATHLCHLFGENNWDEIMLSGAEIVLGTYNIPVNQSHMQNKSVTALQISKYIHITQDITTIDMYIDNTDSILSIKTQNFN